MEQQLRAYSSYRTTTHTHRVYQRERELITTLNFRLKFQQFHPLTLILVAVVAGCWLRMSYVLSLALSRSLSLCSPVSNRLNTHTHTRTNKSLMAQTLTRIVPTNATTHTIQTLGSEWRERPNSHQSNEPHYTLSSSAQLIIDPSGGRQH